MEVKELTETDLQEHATDLMRINLRGRVFEVDRDCLLRQPGSRLHQLAQKHENSASPCYFNRNSQLFEHIVDYYVSGSLHFPHSLCMSVVQEELAYWGLHESHLADCCYAHYKEEEENETKRHEILREWDFVSHMKRESSRLLAQAQDNWRLWVHLLLEEPRSSKMAFTWSVVVKLMVLLSICVVVLETVPALRVHTDSKILDMLEENDNTTSLGIRELTSTMPVTALIILEYVTVIFLSIHFFLRLAFSLNKKRFFCDFLNMCELVSLLPCYAIAVILIILTVSDYHEGLAKAYVILSIVRIIRLLRLYQIAIQYQAVRVIRASLKESVRELLLIVLLLFCVSVFFAAVLFYTEIEVNNIDSIPLAMWWAVVTITTVGYGDYYPITGGGYFVGCLCAISGILVIALPTPIIVNNFTLLYGNYQTCQMLAQRHSPGEAITGRSQNHVTAVKEDPEQTEGQRRPMCQGDTRTKTANNHDGIFVDEYLDERL